MRTHPFLSLVAVLLLAAPKLAAAGADITGNFDEKQQQQMVEQFINQIVNLLQGGADAKQSGQKNAPGVCVCVPGLAIPYVDQPDNPQEAREMVNTFLDYGCMDTSTAPNTTHLYVQNPIPYSQTWTKILNNYQPLGKEEPTPQEVTEAQTYFDQKNDEGVSHFDEYYDTKSAIDTAKASRDASKPSTPDWAGFNTTYNKLNSRFNTSTLKRTMEKYLQVLTQYNATAPSAWWTAANDRFSRANLGDTYDVTTYPSPNQWYFGKPRPAQQPADDGQPPAKLSNAVPWMKISFDSRQSSSYSHTSNTAITTQVKVNYGLFSGTGHGNYSQAASDALKKVKSMVFSCELTRVTLIRRWMDMSLFNSTDWGWKPNSRNLPNLSGANGDLPCVTVSFIVARNIKFKLGLDESSEHALKTAIDTGASVGFGPVSIGGSYKHGEETIQSEATVANGEISVKNPEILAWQYLKVGKNPNPKTPAGR
jgi:hypothetical protein